MTYKVLTRKKRPKLFDDVMGHEAVVRSLKKAIKSSSVGHAYVFSGTRGIGKTSVARIFAKTLICEDRKDESNPCLVCSSCISIDEGSSLNVMEVDGASHNGVDNIRSLIDGVSYLPTHGHYRVYIIDEVHMLSTSAFNALLKTLEEPPAHAVFILATTEPEKIPATVLSRCQKYNFKLASQKTLQAYLKKILSEEGITVENDACINKLISLGQGSFRDTLSLVDQIMSLNDEQVITEEVLWTGLGIAPTNSLESLAKQMLEGKAESVSSSYQQIISHNVDLKHFALDLLDIFFKVIKYKTISTNNDFDLDSYGSSELFWIYEMLLKDLKSSLDSMDPINATEIVLLKCASRREFFKTKPLPQKKNVQNSTEVTPTRTMSTVAPGKELNKTAVTESTEPKMKAEERSRLIAEMVDKTMEKPARREKQEFKASPVVSQKPEPIKEPQTHSVAKQAVQESTPIPPIETKTEIKPVVKEIEIEEESYPSWAGFLKYAFKKNPAIAANLEQGNLVGDINLEEELVNLEVGFPSSGRVFWDYVSDTEVKARLIKLLAGYFKTVEANIRLELSIVSGKKSSDEFRTQAQIYAEKDSTRKMEMQDTIKENTMINYAEKIFSSKVERVDLFEQ